MGRFQGRGRNSGRGRGSRSGGDRKKSSNSSSTTTKKKSMSDYVYYIGSARQASDYVTVTNYIINYIRRTYDKGNDIATALEKLEEVDFTSREPQLKISKKTDQAEKAREDKQFEKQYEIEYTEFNKTKNKYEDNKCAADALLWNQCTNTMKAKIQARKDYTSTVKGNPIKLLEAIKQHALSYESTQYQMKTIFEAMRSLVNLKQKDGEEITDYLRRFKAAKDVFLSHVGKDFCFERVIEGDKDYAQLHTDLITAYENKQEDEAEKLCTKIKESRRTLMEPFMAYMYLDNADKSKYGTLTSGLDTQHSLGNDQFPKTLIDAQNVLDNHTWDASYKKKKQQQQDTRKNNQDSKKEETSSSPGLSFAQLRNECYCCGKSHKLPDCPERNSRPKAQWHINKAKEVKQYNSMVASIEKTMNADDATAASSVTQDTGAAASQAGGSTSQGNTWQFFNFNVSHQEDDLREYMTLDSGASTDLFCRKDWLQNLKTSSDPITLATNAGDVQVDQVGTLQDYGEVPVHEDALTNLMSLAKLSDKYEIHYNNREDDAFYVHTPSKVVRFGRNAANLYVHKPTAIQQHPKQYSNLLQTVEDNMKLHTPREVKRAKQARDLLVALGSPSIQDLKTALATNAIANVPVTTKDVDLAEMIFGKDLGTIKGKTTRQKPVPMVHDQITIPPEISDRGDLELCLDIMFVNELPYMTTISRDLYYRTALSLPTRTERDLYKSLDEVLRMYNAGGFAITKIYCDGEFKSIMDPVKDDLDVDMEYSAPQAHVPEAERNNRTIKERVRATFHRLPYAAIPIVFMKILVSESARKLNFFPNKNGLSPYFSPRQILHREGLDFKQQCQYVFGSYVQAHDEPRPSNTQEPRSIDAIYMRPIKNGHEVYDLKTQRIITRRSLTALPITPAIISAVEAIAKAQKQKGLRVKTKQGHTIYDSTWTAGVDYESDYDSDEDSDYELDSEDEEDEEEQDDQEDESSNAYEHEAQDLLYEEQSAGVQEDPEDKDQDPVQADEDQEEEEEEPQPRRSGREREPRRIISPSMTGTSHGTRQVHLQVKEEDATPYDKELAHCAVNLLSAFKSRSVWKKTNRQHSHLVTYSLQKGLKKFGRAGFDSAKSEMQQLHDRDCWKPISVHSMSSSEKKKALESLIFLVEKKSGKIKSRHCANGSKQRSWINSDEAASPTVMTESVMLTATVEAHEKRDIATFDIPNAFIQTHVDERDSQGDRIVMKIRGAMVDMLIEIDPEYEDFVAVENGQRVLYVHILRAIYGMLMSGLLFYKKFRASIEKIGYEVNPYDPCVANKIINGKQHTISWHVDDLKSSHVDPKVNDDFHKWLQKEYGQVREVTATRGPRHDYLGMTLDFSTPGEVKIDMKDYVKSMVEEFPLDLPGTSRTPANENLFKVDRGKPISSLKAEAFHTFVAKALFLTKRARPDIMPTVAFLCTRVQNPTSYDWMKLVRMMDFLQRTREDCLTLAAEGPYKLVWSIDAAFAVHPDMKSHSGITMTMGKGAIISASKKQKLNTRSSTEAELVAVDDGMAHVVWSRNFLEAQGLKVESVVVLQDNESTIKLAKNGHKSVGQRSRHINIRYFFVTDQVKRGIVTIEYCPTDDMKGDYMSKPLTGGKFEGHRVDIMNLTVRA